MGSIRVNECLALPITDYGVAGSSPAEGEIPSESKRRLTVIQSQYTVYENVVS